MSDRASARAAGRPLRTEQEFFVQDARRVARNVEELQRQLGFYHRNGAGDEIRFLHIDLLATRIKRDASRAARRYWRHANEKEGSANDGR